MHVTERNETLDGNQFNTVSRLRVFCGPVDQPGIQHADAG